MDDAELRRLAEDASGARRWKWWGPYVSARQWGTVREDYSADGNAWTHFPFDHARSRAYRWGEDGLAAICDRWQHLCVGLALWNGADPFLKERLFGLANEEGNHGEDVKEYWWILDCTPTCSWARWLYKYPQAAFPYDELRAENRRRSRHDPEYELIDTGVFDDDRYFDVEVTYAKAAPEDICIEITADNRGPDPAPLHVLPTVWFRNTWSWGRDDRRPRLAIREGSIPAVTAHHGLSVNHLLCDGAPELLFCENETNNRLLWNVNVGTPFPKDGITDHVVSGAASVNPDRAGTKAAAWYRLTLAPGERTTVRLRLTADEPDPAPFGSDFEATRSARRREADEFFARVESAGGPAEVAAVQRQAFASLLWAKKHYRFDVNHWLDGDPAMPPPPPTHALVRNVHWRHLHNADVISMPDEWEYPWYAAWDLAFHMIPMALVDPDFAKDQLVLFLREWFMHPNGQLPAYEWHFDDVNPPVHAWACWRVYKIDAAATGRRDLAFLERVFHKLLINFSWWVNRKDAEGNSLYEGGFLGLDNIGLFDRSQPLPGGAVLEQSDATSWMAMYCLNMLAMALELASHDRVYEDVATKFFEHFLAIATAASHRAGLDMWDEDDGFFYDVLCQDLARIPLKVRSWVGLIPLFAVETIESDVLDALPEFRERARWFVRKRPEQSENLYSIEAPGEAGRRMLSIVGPRKLRLILRRMLDPDEFLSPYGLRSLSRRHLEEPVRLVLDGQVHEVRYSPAESDVDLFGGNSNWRGPIWYPLNFLMIESLQKFHYYFGDDFTVECPTGSGRGATLWDVAAELSRRLITTFLPDGAGRRPVNGGVDRFDFDPHWRDHVTFAEYFHGDTGAGLGATHQTGWTALVAKLIRQSGHLA